MLKRIIKRIKKKKSENDVYDQEETCIDSKPAESEVHFHTPFTVTSPNIHTMNKGSEEVHFVYKGINKKVPDNVTHVRFHPNVTRIEDYNFEEYGPSNNAFMNCASLSEVVLNDGLIEIGRSAFQGCVSLQKITIPSTVTKIDVDAFNDCVNLREVVLNEGLQKIGWQAFFNCQSLVNITLPSTVTEVGHAWTFTMCLKLKEVVLNEGLEEICLHTFNSCSSLERITIPSTVTKIGDGAFLGCDNLREVLLHENIKKMVLRGSNQVVQTFRGCTSLERFKFPSLSTRLGNIIQTGQTDIEAKIDGISSLERDDSELFVTATAMGDVTGFKNGRNWNTVKESLDEISKLIDFYEVREATSLFELALWKARIDQADDADEINRDACRIEVPGPVKETILQYII